MIELPVGTLPVDFLTSVMSHFRNLAGKPDGRDQGFQARMNDFPVIGDVSFEQRIVGSPGGKHCKSL